MVDAVAAGSGGTSPQQGRVRATASSYPELPKDLVRVSCAISLLPALSKVLDCLNDFDCVLEAACEIKRINHGPGNLSWSESLFPRTRRQRRAVSSSSRLLWCGESELDASDMDQRKLAALTMVETKMFVIISSLLGIILLPVPSE